MANRTLTIHLSFDEPAIEQLEDLYETEIPSEISVHVDSSDSGLEKDIGTSLGVFFGLWLRKTYGLEAATVIFERINRNFAG